MAVSPLRQLLNSRRVLGAPSVYAAALTAILVLGIEGLRQQGIMVPAPFLLILMLVMVWSGMGGLAPGLTSATIAMGYIGYATLVSFGPEGLTGHPLRAAMGCGVLLVVSSVLGQQRDSYRSMAIAWQTIRANLDDLVQFRTQELEEARAALAERESTFQQILDHLPSVFWLVDPTLKGLSAHLYISPSYEVIFGKTCQSLYEDSFSFLEIVHPEDRAYVEQRFRLEESEGLNVEFRILQGPEQRIRWIHARSFPVYGADGSCYRVAGIADDISDRKIAELALRDSEQRYASLMAAAPVGIFRSNRAGNCIYVNETCCEIMGLTPDQCYGLGWTQVLHPDDRDRVLRQWQQSLENHSLFQEEYRFLRLDHSVVWVYGQAIFEMDSQGQFKGSMGTITNITAQKTAEEQVRYNASHDSLTGLANRVLLMERLEKALAKHKNDRSHQFALLFFDLDRFKIINDSLGHFIGDRLLQAIAQKLKSQIQPKDTACRLGGDEFVILLDVIQGPEEAITVAQRIQAELQVPVTLGEHQAFTSTSIGIALSDTGYDRAADMLRDADNAMYRAKTSGRACYQIFDRTMHDQALQRLRLETDLRIALDRQELSLAYQPIVSLVTGQLLGFEALVRWYHPRQGWISPGQFIPVAEDSGLILSLSQWILQTACQQMQTWKRDLICRSKFPLNLFMGVNISAKQFQQTNFLAELDQILQNTQLNPQALKLEITESLLLDQHDRVVETLSQLRSRQIRVSIDDFGTGYSSLSYLKRFPLDTLKVDQSFVRELEHSKEDARIVEAIVTLSHNLGLDVVAEGVETLEQLIYLRQLGCEAAQGYLFSQALPAPEAAQLIEKAIVQPLLNASTWIP
ncbi:MAG: sensor domain-containing protein [Prochlorothrix sp.]